MLKGTILGVVITLLVGALAYFAFIQKEKPNSPDTNAAVGSATSSNQSSFSSSLFGSRPSPDSPPSNDEMLAAYIEVWNQDVSVGGVTTAEWRQAIAPIVVKPTGQAITSETPNGKVYDTNVIIIFRANANVSYLCTPMLPAALMNLPTMYYSAVNIMIETSGNHFDVPVAEAAKGTMISCKSRFKFQKVGEGWLLKFAMGQSLIRR